MTRRSSGGGGGGGGAPGGGNGGGAGASPAGNGTGNGNGAQDALSRLLALLAAAGAQGRTSEQLADLLNNGSSSSAAKKGGNASELSAKTVETLIQKTQEVIIK